jgi:hypothetical protein
MINMQSFDNFPSQKKPAYKERQAGKLCSIYPFTQALLALFLFLTVRAAMAQPSSPALTIEAEDFVPIKPALGAGWKAIRDGEGNYMVDIVGFNHVSGEHLLQAPASAKNATAKADITIPASGTYRVWSRFEQPTNCDNRFRVEVEQSGKVLGSATMGEKDAPKHFFNAKQPVAQADPSWGSEGLVEQSFDVKGLQYGPATITLTAVDQSTLPTAANRNLDFLYLTQDLEDNWRTNKSNNLYPILDAALAALPPRYYLRLTAPQAQTVQVRYSLNRVPWGASEGALKLQAGESSNWLPLTQQDVAHWTTLVLTASTPAIDLHAELASAPNENAILRTIDWQDAASNTLQISLPPYPNKYAGEKVMTVEEQYQNITRYLEEHPSHVGREPKQPLAWGGSLPVWEPGRVGKAASSLYHTLGLCSIGLFPPNANTIQKAIAVAQQRFTTWGLVPARSIALGLYRNPPTPENIAKVKAAAEGAGVLPLLARFDYGDEISFSEWLESIPREEQIKRFVEWQQKRTGKAEFPKPNSNASTAANNPILYVDSLKFYDEAAINHVANQAKEVTAQLGDEVLYGANVGAHPFYYPRIAPFIKWFRKTPSGDYAANFGRHSEYFWEVGLPGPLINGYVAEHFRCGMRDNPQASNIQYTMPHAPGNTDADFIRSAFTHLAHGARGLDYFGVGINSAWTENYIDFRYPSRYAALRDVNRSMAFIEDILPTSRPVPSKVALILSDSTERWDFAPIASDRAFHDVWGDRYKQMRLAYHQERVGIYYALVHNSRPPDLLIEEDVQNGALKDYDVAYWVGDCIEPSTLKALSSWVQSGGQLVATAGAFRYDEYHRDLPEGLKLLGLQSAELREVNRFFRPQIEMPHLKPLDWVGEMPALAMTDAVKPAAGSKVLASFKSGQPAVVESTHGKGSVTYIGTLPGVAYLWSAYQPPPVPSRSPSSHMPLKDFNREAGRLITKAAKSTLPNVDGNGNRIDARLLKSPNGYAIALANYSLDAGQPVTLTIRGVPDISSISSASAGRLKMEATGGDAVTVRYAPGYGDSLRIETK